VHIGPTEIRFIAFYVLALVVSTALHEFGHAYTAYRLGDDTPLRQGRVTLNPIAHADPIGTILLPLVGAIYAASSHGGAGGFGWGKPVEWQPARVRRSIKMTTAVILVSIAGPGMNLLLGTVSTFTHAALFTHLAGDSKLHEWFGILSITNFTLFVFNLIPLPPLDGGHVIQSLTPVRHRRNYDEIAKYGPFILLGVLFIEPVRDVILWPAIFLYTHMFLAFGHLFGFA
jgi:Zn-dependent protease